MKDVYPFPDGYWYRCEGFEEACRYDDRPPYARMLPEQQLRRGPDVEYPSGDDTNLTRG